VFGLVLDIYLILSAAFLMSLIGAHAWSLDIAARRFNLRLGLSLRTRINLTRFVNIFYNSMKLLLLIYPRYLFIIILVWFKQSEDVPFQFRQVVPFRRLFAEYLIITTFPKIMGQAFIVVLNAFFLFIVRLYVDTNTCLLFFKLFNLKLFILCRCSR